MPTPGHWGEYCRSARRTLLRLWDYINRGHALGEEGTLTADEVYALTAYLLSMNGVIAEDAVMDRESLRVVVMMPNRDNWAPLPDWKPGMPRLPDYLY